MHQLSHVLYITQNDVRLCLRGEAIECESHPEMNIHIPLHNIESIITFSTNPATDILLAKCMKNGINVTVLNRNGRFMYKIAGNTRGNVLLRRNQVYLCDSEDRSLALAKQLIDAKIQNSISQLSYFKRKHKEKSESISKIVSSMKLLRKELESVNSKDELRGIEGQCAALYFKGFSDEILVEDTRMQMQSRNRRPPKDPVNALLSLMYVILANDYVTALESVGVDPYMGILHGLRPGKASMALDMMEETRSVIADRFVLRLINLSIMQPHMFEYDEENGCYLNEEGRKRFFLEWNKFRSTYINHPVHGKIPIGILPFVQAKAMADFISGRAEHYVPFLSKGR